MRRREFIAGLESAAAWPVTAWAQQRGVPVIGVLSGTSPEGYSVQVAGLLRGLADSGYVDGRNVAIEWRWARDPVRSFAEVGSGSCFASRRRDPHDWLGSGGVGRQGGDYYNPNCLRARL